MAKSINFVEDLGDKVVGKDGEVSLADLVAGADVVGVYFSAHWCPPCRNFTPVLTEWYEMNRDKGKKLEIVFVSSDRDEASFKEYFGEMPWHAMSFSARDKKGAVCQKFGIQGIPTFILFNAKTGDVIDMNGRGVVTAGKFPDV
jgi:nucleoredoxin